MTAEQLKPQQVSMQSELEALRSGGQLPTVRLSVLPDDGNGAALHALLETVPNVPFDVELVMFHDSFEVHAGDATAIVQLAGFGGDAEAWVASCVGSVRFLLANDLVVRVRRGLFGRKLGAIRLGQTDKPVWNGDLLAVLGFGTVVRFPEWLASGEVP